MMRALLLRGILIGLLATPCGASVIYVDDDAPLGGDGLTWETPFTYLQDALAVAQAGDDIRVAQGTYKPDQDEAGNVTSGDREATFQLVNGVAIYGGYAGLGAADPDERDIELYETVLSGDLAGDDEPDFVNHDENSYHVLNGSSTDTTAILDGFSIVAGYGNGSSAYDDGGGIRIVEGSPALANCTFTANYGVAGGAMINVWSSNPTITDCSFIGNRAEAEGGAIRNGHGSNSAFTNCTFFDNHASQGGGAISNIDGSPIFTNCLFSGNVAANAGGAMINEGSGTATLLNCTFVSNSVQGSFTGGIYQYEDSISTVINCVLWGNSDDGGTDESAQLGMDQGGAVIVDYSCIQGLTGALGGTGNIGSDPLLADPDGPDDIPGTADDDLHLLDGSPCINTGTNDDPNLPALDFEGEPRIQQCRVDMGADESPYFAADCNSNGIPDECEADFDGDGLIDDCDPDVDGDGVLNELDLCPYTPLGVPVNEDGRPMGDWDEDCVVDFDDFEVYAICLDISGPGIPALFQECRDVFDFNDDEDVDLADFAEFQVSFGVASGP